MSDRTRKIMGVIIGAVLVVAAAVVIVSLVGGGGENDSAQARETDGAFIAGMVPHHESAVDMANVALDRAQHPEIKQLAKDIVSSQTDEIDRLEAAHQRLFGASLSSMSGEHGSMGMSQDEMGMSGDMAELEDAKPFDRTFIDMMVSHHQGAIEMARVELQAGSDPELKAMAQDIVDAQSREIDEMNQWREGWYGAPSPAGEVPAGEEAPSHMR